MSQNKALSMIGLATKAGKVASGEFCTEKEVKSGRAYLVIVADDASDNTKKKFQNMCDFIRSRSIFTKIKIHWGMQWEKSSVHLWLSWMRICKRNPEAYRHRESDNCIEEADYMSNNKDIETNTNENTQKSETPKKKNIVHVIRPQNAQNGGNKGRRSGGNRQNSGQENRCR